MAFGSNDIEIKVKVDAQGAVQVFDQVGNKIADIEGKAKKGESAWTTYNQTLQGITSTLRIVANAAQSVFSAISKGDEINDISAAFKRLSENAGESADVFINQLNKATQGAISNFDLMKEANLGFQRGLSPKTMLELAESAKALGEAVGVNAKDSFDKLVNAVSTGNVRLLKDLGITIEKGDGLAAALEKIKKKAQDLGPGVDGAGDSLDQLSKTSTDLKNSFFSAIDKSDGFKVSIQLLDKALKSIDTKKAIAEIENLARAVAVLIDGLSKAVGYFASGGKFDQFLSKTFANAPFEETERQLEQIVKILEQDTTEATKEAAKRFTDLVGTVNTLDEALKARLAPHMQLVDQQIAAVAGDKGLLKLSKSTKETTEAVEGLTGKTKDSIEVQNKWKESISSEQKELEKLRKEFEKIKGLTPAQELDQFGASIDKLIPKTHELVDALSAGLSGAFENGIGAALSGGGLDDIESGIKDATRPISAGVGAAVGGTIGFGIGGPIGAAIGAGAGAAISTAIDDAIISGVFDGIDHAFNGRDAQGKIRDALDALFIEALKDNPLQAIINGQLQSITDLTFGKGTNAFVDGSFDDAFQSMGESAQRAFQGISTGFTEVLGQGQELSSQLAAVFANNLGGSLNNLQLLVEATGKSFEDLRKGVVEAFLDGKLSALEAQTALIGIQQVSEKGIPGAIGAVTEAFNNLKAAGVKGGRALIDALQDIGFEARELGIKDLAGVQANLAATGQFSAEEIQKVFDALKANGIDSIEELTGATADQLIPVLSQLQASVFPFAEAAEKVGDLAEKLNRLPERIDTTVHVNFVASGDQAARNIIGQQAGIAL